MTEESGGKAPSNLRIGSRSAFATISFKHSFHRLKGFGRKRSSGRIHRRPGDSCMQCTATQTLLLSDRFDNNDFDTVVVIAQRPFRSNSS
jgi:hypothetical protein